MDDFSHDDDDEEVDDITNNNIPTQPSTSEDTNNHVNGFLPSMTPSHPLAWKCRMTMDWAKSQEWSGIWRRPANLVKLQEWNNTCR